MMKNIVFVFFLAAGLSCVPNDPVELTEQFNLEPELIGSGVISSEMPEFATTFSPDGKTVYFNRTNSDRSVLQILSAENIDGVWQEPSPLPFSNGTYFDVDPFVTYDGTRLYFNSDRPIAGGGPKDLDIWYVERVENGWSEPINAGQPLNGDGDEVFVSVAENQAMYFSISTDGVRKIYRSERVGDSYTDPQLISIPIADSIGIGNPLIDRQDKFILFTSVQLGGRGGADIYIADHLGDGRFENVRSAGAQVNSAYSDFAPGLSPDGKYLYFASERPGVVGPLEEGRPPGDLYRIPLEEIFRPQGDN